MNLSRIVLGILAGTFAVWSPRPASAAAKATPPEFELILRVKDKEMGKEALRRTSGQEGVYFSTSAELRDKVKKVWRDFTERSYVRYGLDGKLVRYDRWIDVKGATLQTKLFEFQGAWKLAESDSEGGKPRVTDLKIKAPFVVLDERVPSLVAVAAERMAGQAAFDYVRVDDGTTGHLVVLSEKLIDKAGTSYHRVSLRGEGVELSVLRDAKNGVVAIQGLGGWSGVAVGRKPPSGLTVVEAKPVAAAAGLSAPVTPAAPVSP